LTGGCGWGRGRLIGERRRLRSLQQRAQVYFKIARIGAESFFSGAPAEAAGLEVVQELFAQIGDQALEPAADGGFMHVEDAGNLEKRLAIEEVGGEEEAVFRRKGLEHAGNGVGKVREFGGDGRRVRLTGWAVEGVEWGLAVGAAVVIDVPLRERGAQPAEQRAAAGVRSQRRLAPAVDLAQAVQFRVERFGKIVAQRGRAGDRDCGLGEGSTIEAEEALPCDFPPEGAGVSESQLREMERVEEGSLLRGIGGSGRGKAMVELRADSSEGDAELF